MSPLTICYTCQYAQVQTYCTGFIPNNMTNKATVPETTARYLQNHSHPLVVLRPAAPASSRSSSPHFASASPKTTFQHLYHSIIQSIFFHTCTPFSFSLLNLQAPLAPSSGNLFGALHGCPYAFFTKGVTKSVRCIH